MSGFGSIKIAEVGPIFFPIVTSFAIANNEY